ncbi:MAG: DNA repair protein RadC [Candidatus Eisenbacteria bacterium]
MFVSELRRRKYRGGAEVVIRGPEDLYKLLRPRIGREDREHFVAVLLSSRSTVIGIETISIGSLNASIVHPREVFKPAIVHSASAIALAHNHPSGDVTPSEEDLAITRRLKEAGRLLGIELVDHIIVGRNAFTSFKERKLLG